MKNKLTGTYTQIVELNGRDVEVTFAATATLYYQAAQTNGPPEDCYPEESDFDLENISIIEAKIPLSLHTMKLLREAIDKNLLEERMWEEFDEAREG